uniref:Putative GIY-YIG homing endonuclease n=1 Tax=Oedocladium carolinianum TaxID=55992 RepID=A0A1D8GXC8_9CHLO|nr:putative GIY-YIG homing endonuclease [Oedocladium carolinianum]AOT84359.1 putative GIY-YIG homing endonuclease [Oedocladium carolinianum]
MSFNKEQNTTNSKNKENLFDISLKSGLYLITCLPLQKHYIGQSGYVTRRLNVHKSLLRRGIHQNRTMQKDFEEYGENAFFFQKLYFGNCLSKEERENFETLILSTLSEKNRYNFYEDWRKRDSILNPFYGKKHNTEAKNALSAAKKGRPSPFAKRQQSDEVKQRLSEENKGKKNRKKALYVDSVYYESIADAAEKIGISRRLIRERCHSSEERFKNYLWAKGIEGIDPD